MNCQQFLFYCAILQLALQTHDCRGESPDDAQAAKASAAVRAEEESQKNNKMLYDISIFLDEFEEITDVAYHVYRYEGLPSRDTRRVATSTSMGRDRDNFEIVEEVSLSFCCRMPPAPAHLGYFGSVPTSALIFKKKGGRSLTLYVYSGIYGIVDISPSSQQLFTSYQLTCILNKLQKRLTGEELDSKTFDRLSGETEFKRVKSLYNKDGSVNPQENG